MPASSTRPAGSAPASDGRGWIAADGRAERPTAAPTPTAPGSPSVAMPSGRVRCQPAIQYHLAFQPRSEPPCRSKHDSSELPDRLACLRMPTQPGSTSRCGYLVAEQRACRSSPSDQESRRRAALRAPGRPAHRAVVDPAAHVAPGPGVRRPRDRRRASAMSDLRARRPARRLSRTPCPRSLRRHRGGPRSPTPVVTCRDGREAAAIHRCIPLLEGDLGRRQPTQVVRPGRQSDGRRRAALSSPSPDPAARRTAGRSPVC